MKVEQKYYNPNITFQYSNILKTLYKKGKLPTVKYGLYGKRLTKKTVSLEHLTPHSLGGKTNLDNLALADRFENSKRGNEPLKNFLKVETAKKYLKQFINVIVDGFNGNEYIKKITKTLKKNGIDLQG